MARHEHSIGKTSEWCTPPHIFHALACTFDLDVASPGQRLTPWIQATHFIQTNSLDVPWSGFVWMNPPVGGRNTLVPWLEKFFAHGDGIALVRDRTSAPWWQRYAPRADLVLFVTPKIQFVATDGKPGPTQGTCLLGVGPNAVGPLRRAAPVLGSLMRPVRRRDGG